MFVFYCVPCCTADIEVTTVNKVSNTPQVCIGRKKKHINSIISDSVKAIKWIAIKECLERGS